MPQARGKGAACAKDACFLAPDVLERRAEPVAMIEAYRGEHRHVGIDDIDRVESSPEPHLEQHGVELFLLKEMQRCEGIELEEGQARVAAHLIDTFESRDELRIRDFAPREANALVVPHEVWRSERRDPTIPGSEPPSRRGAT